MASNSFCILPWIQLATKPNGQVNLCCYSSQTVFINKNKGRPYQLDQDNLAEIWNCEDLLSIRRQMLQGDKPKSCNVCYKEEFEGKTSLRILKNNQWLPYQNFEFSDRINKINLDKEKYLPFYYDLRLGNKCNLKCRMCFPVNSSGVSSEYAQVLEQGLPFPKIYTENTIDEDENFDWSASNHFKSEFKSCYPYIKELYFTGGEPFLNEFVEQLMQDLISEMVSSEITLTFNTNCTVWNKNFIEKFNFFKEVNIVCSIDGIDQTDEYIRFPTSFKKVNTIFDEYIVLAKKSKNIFIAVNTSVSWLNVFDLFKLADWLINKNCISFSFFRNISFGLVHAPETLNIKMLPPTLKSKVLDSLKSTIDLLLKQEFKSKLGTNDLVAICEMIKNSSEVSHDQIKNLINHIESIDMIRKQNLKNFIPTSYEVFSFYKNLFIMSESSKNTGN